MAHAAFLAQRANLSARIVHVVEHVGCPRWATLETAEEASLLVEEAVFALRMAGVGSNGVVRPSRVNQIASTLLEEADSSGADVIMSGARHQFHRWHVGRGVREQVLRCSLRPVVLVRTAPRGTGGPPRSSADAR